MKKFMLLLILLFVSACGADTKGDLSGQKEYVKGPEIIKEVDILPESGSLDASSVVVADQGSKIAYVIDTSIETKDLDAAMELLVIEMNKYQGFIENSNISAESGYARYRLRIPTKDYPKFLEGLSATGNQYSINTSATNLDSQFVDVEARLDTLNVQEERLIEILKNATAIEDVIKIEERLSNIRYEIENYTRTLNLLSQRVQYSIINVEFNEVIEFVNNDSFFDELGSTFNRSLTRVVDDAKNFAYFITFNLPYILVFAAVIFLFRKKVGKGICNIKNRINNKKR